MKYFKKTYTNGHIGCGKWQEGWGENFHEPADGSYTVEWVTKTEYDNILKQIQFENKKKDLQTKLFNNKQKEKIKQMVEVDQTYINKRTEIDNAKTISELEKIILED